MWTGLAANRACMVGRATSCGRSNREGHPHTRSVAFPALPLVPSALVTSDRNLCAWRTSPLIISSEQPSSGMRTLSSLPWEKKSTEKSGSTSDRKIPKEPQFRRAKVARAASLRPGRDELRFRVSRSSGTSCRPHSALKWVWLRFRPKVHFISSFSSR